MVSNSTLDRLSFYVPIALEIPIAYILFRRRLYRETAWFTIYIVYQLMSTIFLYPVYESGDRYAYFYLSWMHEAISVTLGFMVILESFRISVTQYQTIRRLGVNLLIIAAFVSIVIAVILVPHHARIANALVNFIEVTERGLRIIQLTLLMAMFALSSYLALSWRNYVFGIALGYGLYAAVTYRPCPISPTWGVLPMPPVPESFTSSARSTPLHIIALSRSG
jgi:hypothetical protein